MVPGSHDYLPINAYSYIKQLDSNGELSGWYHAKVIEYYADGSCTVFYSNSI